MLERSRRIGGLIWRPVGRVEDSEAAKGDGRVLGLVRHVRDLGDLCQRHRRGVGLVVALGLRSLVQKCHLLVAS